MFSTFAEDKLPVINTNDSSNKVSAWKNSSVVAECYKKLKTNGDYYLNKILDKVYGTDLEKRSEMQVAFTIVLVQNSEMFGMFSQIFKMYAIQYN